MSERGERFGLKGRFRRKERFRFGGGERFAFGGGERFGGAAEYGEVPV